MLARTGRGGACSSRIRDTFQIRTHPRRGELRSPEICDFFLSAHIVRTSLSNKKGYATFAAAYPFFVRKLF